MLRLQWTTPARRDLLRLHDFLDDVNPHAAKRVLNTLIDAAENIPEYPQVAYRLEDFAPRDVRSLIVGDYELRYELTSTAVLILRIWHTREDR